jgi:hypothetical protein
MRSRIVASAAVVCAAAGVLGAGTLASGQPASTSKAKAKGDRSNRALFAVLNGRKEVDPEGNRGVGDPDGRGSFTAIVDGSELCFGVTVKNLDAPVAAHIHKGRPNQAGPIVVSLSPPAVFSGGDPGAASGCVTIAADLARAILKNPHKYYTNVHTAAFPGGAVRGQLFAKQR